MGVQGTPWQSVLLDGALSDFCDVYAARHEALSASLRTYLHATPACAPLVAHLTDERLTADAALDRASLALLRAGDASGFEASVRETASRCARLGLKFPAWLGLARCIEGELRAAVATRFAESPARAARAHEAAEQFFQWRLAVGGDAFVTAAAAASSSELIAYLGHELRTPLNTVTGFTELLTGGAVATDQPQFHEFLGDILEAGRRGLQVLADAVELTRAEAGELAFDPRPVAPRTVLEAALAHAASALGTRTVTVDVDPRLPEIACDPQRLGQVLHAYLQTALKTTGPRDGFTLRAVAEGDEAFRVELGDARGAAATQWTDQLAATAPGNPRRGMPLALTLARRIVEAQGGAVGVQTTPGSGTTLWARLPRRAAVPRQGGS